MKPTMSAPVFTSGSRLMLIAPHPDDEALACSVILQRAVGAGAAIHVLYATDGDNNPWPQRVLERKWRLDAADRQRWGKLRRAEALAALNTLGVRPADTRFLGLPDQQLTDLLVTHCQSSFEKLATSVNDWSLTHLLVPSIHDTHPDHSALAVILRLVLGKLYPDGPPMSVWAYAVHGNSQAFFDRAQKLSQSKTEIAVKKEAIRCHKTQLKLSRRRFLAYAPRPESFLKLETRESTAADGPIRWISRQSDVLRLELLLSAKPMRYTGATLFVLGHDRTGTLRCVRTPVPVHSSAVELFDCHSCEPVAVAQYHRDGFAGEFAIPLDVFSAAHALFVKLERRRWFFDEAGWLETPPATGESTVSKMITPRRTRAEVPS
ncbi:MAG: PIG-L family deacetylase [Candidatus Udaeobacter sp.]